MDFKSFLFNHNHFHKDESNGIFEQDLIGDLHHHHLDNNNGKSYGLNRYPFNRIVENTNSNNNNNKNNNNKNNKIVDSDESDDSNSNSNSSSTSSSDNDNSISNSEETSEDYNSEEDDDDDGEEYTSDKENNDNNNNNNNNNGQFSLTNNWFVNTFFKTNETAVLNSNINNNKNKNKKDNNNNKKNKNKRNNNINKNKDNKKKSNEFIKPNTLDLFGMNGLGFLKADILTSTSSSSSSSTTINSRMERMLISNPPLGLIIREDDNVPIVDTYTISSPFSSGSSSLSTSTDTSITSNDNNSNDLDKINKLINSQLIIEQSKLNNGTSSDNNNNNNNGSSNDQLLIKCIDCLNIITDIEKVIFLDCTHIYCKKCLYNFIKKRIDEKRVSKIKCKSCKISLSVYDIKQVLTDEEYSIYDDASLDQAISRNKDSYIQCPCCNLVMEKVIIPLSSLNSNKNGAIKSNDHNQTIEYDENGKQLSRESIEHKRKFRFRCPQCSCVFCTECKIQPYHLGYTCAQFQIYNSSKHCRFCRVAICPITPIVSPRLSLKPNNNNNTTINRNNINNNNNNNNNNNCCSNDECISKSIKSCQKILTCGHECLGILDETKCLPCIHPDCNNNDYDTPTPLPTNTTTTTTTTTTNTTVNNDIIKKPNLINKYKTNQKSNDYCNICWTDSLSSEPCIQLECGHIFHKKCCSSVLKKRWTSSRISFGFVKCALCSQNMQHPCLDKYLTPINELYGFIKVKALNRLSLFGVEKDVDFDDPLSKWYNNKEGYVMDRFSYFMCFKCKKPYFGGEKVCAIADENRIAGEHKPEELVCGGCSSSGNENCKIHGKEFIEYKCKYCCRISAFFCWGNSHFCVECHRNVNHVAQIPKTQLPQCKCEGSEKHISGEEFCYGCSMCKIISNSE
ncbi:hypothetical protein ACTFIW_009212 [Dictyostelium discoideum]